MDCDEDRIDKIHIRELLLRCIIGVNPDEREKKQDVVINLTLSVDLREACRTDHIDDTINYKLIKQRVKLSRSRATNAPFHGTCRNRQVGYN